MRRSSCTFKQNGYRLTEQRKKILDALTDKPQSVIDVMRRLKEKRTSIDKTTIYRTLDCLVELGVVGKTWFQDKEAKYELISKEKHHHHLVCNRCGHIEDISFDEVRLEEQVNKRTKFKVLHHVLEFFGICAKCQQTV